MISFTKLDVQDQLNQVQQLFGIAVQKPEIPYPAKPFRENMLEDKLQKILSFKCAITGFAGFAFRIPERYPAVLIGNDIVFTDDAPV